VNECIKERDRAPGHEPRFDSTVYYYFNVFCSATRIITNY